MVKVGQDFVSEGKNVESDAADLYKNILKPMVKVGQDFVSEGKATGTKTGDLCIDVMEPIIIGMDLFLEVSFFDIFLLFRSECGPNCSCFIVLMF
jgi:hypothetical protein